FAADTLVNSRHRPFRNQAEVAWDDETAFRGDGNPATSANARVAARNLLVEGAFNINSTSVEAWKAVFSSLKNVPVAADPTPNAPRPTRPNPPAPPTPNPPATPPSPCPASATSPATTFKPPPRK